MKKSKRYRVLDGPFPYGKKTYAVGDVFDGKDWVRSDLEAALKSRLVVEQLEEEKSDGETNGA